MALFAKKLSDAANKNGVSPDPFNLLKPRVPSLPFQIPVANPITGAVQLIQGTVQDGLKNLDDATRAVLASASEIPLVHPDGTVTVVPGGEAGLKSLAINPEAVVQAAPNIPSTELNPDAIPASIPSQFNLFDPLGLAQRLPIPLPVPQLNVAVPTLDSLTNPLKTIQGLTQTATDTIAATANLPIVLPNGGLSIVKGGLDGLNALKEDVHGVVQDGAAKLSSGVAAGIAGAAQAAGVGGQTGLPLPLGTGLFNPLNGLGAVAGVANGIASGLNPLNRGPLGLLTSLTNPSPEMTSLIKSILAFPSRLATALTKVTNQLHTDFDALTSESTGPYELAVFLALHMNTIFKLTVLALLWSVAVVLGLAVLGVGALVFATVFGTPIVGALWMLLAVEVVMWGYFRNVKKDVVQAQAQIRGSG